MIQQFCATCKTIHFGDHECESMSGSRSWEVTVRELCNDTCENWGTKNGSEGCLLSPTKPCDIGYYRRKGRGCFDTQNPRFGDKFRSVDKDQLAIITFHYNSCRYQRLRDTYDEWLPTLGEWSDVVQCYELVINDDEPEIPDSIVMQGDWSNQLWQKEAIINHAVSQLPPEKRYVAWIDHDLIFRNNLWVQEAVSMLDGGFDAVQLFNRIEYWDRERKVIRKSRSRAAMRSGGAPGGAWMANRELFERITMPHWNVVGGGDFWFASAVQPRRKETVQESIAKKLPPKLAEKNLAYVADGKRQKFRVGHVSGKVFHIWHGDRKHRQYLTREQILKEHDFDPDRDITVTDGLVRWSSDKSELHAAVAGYFQNRRDDG